MLRKILIVSGLIFSNSSFAVTMSEIIADRQPLMSLSIAPAWNGGASSQTLFLQPDVQKTYTAKNNGSAFPSAEFFFAWQKPLERQILGQTLMSQLGFVLNVAGNAEQKGDVWEDADPNFNNFNYRYKVTHAHIAIKGRLIAQTQGTFQPYVSASVGVGLNHADDFIVNPTIYQEVPSPAFNSSTTTAFIYSIGVGLQRSFNPHVQVGVGYEFADWGRVQLSPANGQTTNQGLSQHHLYVQQLQLALFYIFGDMT